jgi:hypothetical protein
MTPFDLVIKYNLSWRARPRAGTFSTARFQAALLGQIENRRSPGRHLEAAFSPAGREISSATNPRA